MATSYPTKQAAVDALFGAGATITGETANFDEVPNAAYNPSVPSAGTNQPTVKKQNGTILSVTRADGKPDRITISAATPVTSGQAGGGKGGVGYTVLTGPTTAATATATPAADWTHLDAKGQVIPPGSSTPTVYLSDPKAPPGTTPFKVEGDLTTDPTKWAQIPDPNDPTGKRIIGLWDPINNKIGASVQAPAGARASDPSKWQPVYRVAGDASTPAVGQWDPVNNELHPISTTADGRQVITTPTALYSFDKDTNTVTKLTDIDPKSPFQSVVIGSQVYKFDPKDGSYTAGPVVHPDIRDASNNPMVWQEDAAGNGKYVYAPGVNPAATVNNSTTLKNLEWFDNQGNLVASHPNSNYEAPPTQLPAQNADARMVPIQDPDHPNQIKWVPNEGRVTASDALKQLASSLTGQIVSGDLSKDEVVTLINSANAKITNDINQQNAENARQQTAAGAANDVLANTRGNAQTAAGLLQQRVQAATSTLQNLVGSALGNKNFGAAGGIPGDMGANLVQGLGSWTAGLMGGQATMDSAARMIQAADPQSSMADPNTQAAVGTLKQMLDKYQELTGGPHPIVSATQAAQQSQQTGGMVAPQTVPFNPQSSTAALNAAGFHDSPAGRQAALTAGRSDLLGAAVGATPSTAGTQAVAPVAAVQPVDPSAFALGQGFSVAGQQPLPPQPTAATSGFRPPTTITINA